MYVVYWIFTQAFQAALIRLAPFTLSSTLLLWLSMISALAAALVLPKGHQAAGLSPLPSLSN